MALAVANSSSAPLPKPQVIYDRIKKGDQLVGHIAKVVFDSSLLDHGRIVLRRLEFYEVQDPFKDLNIVYSYESHNKRTFTLFSKKDPTDLDSIKVGVEALLALVPQMPPKKFSPL